MVDYSEETRVELRRVHQAMMNGDLARANEMASLLLDQGIEHAMLLSIVSGEYERKGEPRRALPLLLRAIELSPEGQGLWNALGLCYQQLEQHEEALVAFDRALLLDPHFTAAMANRATTLIALARLVEAKAEFEAALAHDPNHVIALAGLAALAARRGNWPEARHFGQTAQSRVPGYPMAVLAEAEADIAEGQLEEAEASLTMLNENDQVHIIDQAIATGLLGDLADKRGDGKTAFAAWTRSGEVFRRYYQSHFSTIETPQLVLDRMTSSLPELCAKEREGSPLRRGPLHVFLIGFPRSGTTLLEQVLEQHPDIETLAEQECLDDHTLTALGSEEGFAQLLCAPRPQLEQKRAAYWAKTASLGMSLNHSVFVDKHPFHSFKLAVLAQLFPDALFIFAQRDPRDVVLSCFRRRFAANGATNQFNSLMGSATLYDATLRHIEMTRKHLPLHWYDCRLEALVEDFDGETDRLCAVLGVRRTDAMADFSQGAQSRGVFTPSGAQLVQGLSRQGIGMWHRYAKEMDPVLPLLEPWVVSLGYDVSKTRP